MKAHRIWLTGSGGFIGSHLAPVLYNVCSELRCFTSNKEVSTTLHREGFCRNYMDFLSEDSINRNIDLFGLPDVFIHLGWGAMADPGSSEHLEGNVKVGKGLISTLYKAGLKKFIFLGSVNEYGGRAGLLSEDMASEGRLTNYAKGKTLVTSFGLEQADKYDKVFISVRLFYTFGPGQRKGSLINKLYVCYQKNLRPSLGLCEHFRDYIYVSEVVEGIKLISNINESTIVNLGSGKAIKLKDFVVLFWEHLGGIPEQIDFGAYPMREGEPEQPYSFAHLDRLKKLTNWMPSLSIEHGIKQTIKGLHKRDLMDLGDV